MNFTAQGLSTITARTLLVNGDRGQLFSGRNCCKHLPFVLYQMPIYGLFLMATTHVKRSKYYKWNFIKTETILSTQHVYELTDTLVNNHFKYRYQSFLFYDNGLVLHEDHYTKSLSNNTLRTFTQDWIKACCHGASIGSYIVQNDRIHYRTKFGCMKGWNYYSAKITDSALMVFETKRRKAKAGDINWYIKNKGRVILKTIKL